MMGSKIIKKEGNREIDESKMDKKLGSSQQGKNTKSKAEKTGSCKREEQKMEEVTTKSKHARGSGNSEIITTRKEKKGKREIEKNRGSRNSRKKGKPSRKEREKENDR